MRAFSKDDCETKENLADRSEILRLLRKDRLKALLQRISGAPQWTTIPLYSYDKKSVQGFHDGGLPSSKNNNG